MSDMEKYLVIGDLQIPYHDPKAVEVMLRVAEDFKPDGLVINGDFCDWRTLSDHYPAIDEPGNRLIPTLKEEVQLQRDLLNEIMDRVKPKMAWWNDGNHEWRLNRMLYKFPNIVQLLGLAELATRLSVESIFSLDRLGIKHSGNYPNGFWLKKGDLWIEHGFNTSLKAGYTVSRLLDARGASVIVGHCERLAVVWKRNIDRKLFGAEGGNLSILGEKAGKGIYSTVPHTAPELMNHQQGFLLLTYYDKQWYPEAVPIYNGVALWRGKVYDSNSKVR